MRALARLLAATPVLLAAIVGAQERANQTVLRPSGMLAGETAEAYVNGQRVGTLDRRTSVDISRYVKPGVNRLTVKWTKPVSLVGANVGYAREPGRFANVGRIRLNGDAALKRPGSKTIAFRIPGAVATTGQARPTYGSAARQTVLKVTGWSESQQVEAFVNGRSVGDLYRNATVDVTEMVRPGTNVLKLVWTGPAEFLGVKIAYAKKPSVFGDATKIVLNTEPSTRKSGSRTIRFVIPR